MVANPLSIRIYPMHYENIGHIDLNTKIQILQKINLNTLYNKIWSENCNMNFYKTLLNSTVFQFYNFDSIYTSVNINYAYQYFFNRMISILYEFLFDIYMELENIKDEVILFYLSKIKTLEEQGYEKYLDIFKQNSNCMNRAIIQYYEKYIGCIDNTQEEYIIMEKYIKSYDHKKTLITTFFYKYLNEFYRINLAIKVSEFNKLYIMPKFLNADKL